MFARPTNSDDESSSNSDESFWEEINIDVEPSEESDSNDDQHTLAPPNRSYEFNHAFKNRNDLNPKQVIIDTVILYAKNSLKKYNSEEIEKQLTASQNNFNTLITKAYSLLDKISRRTRHDYASQDRLKAARHKIKLAAQEWHRLNTVRVYDENINLKGELSEYKTEVIRLAKELHELKKQASISQSHTEGSTPRLFK